MTPAFLLCLSLSHFGLDESLFHELNLRVQYPDVATRYLARLRERRLGASRGSGVPAQQQFRHTEEPDPLFNDDAYEKFLARQDESLFFLLRMHDDIDQGILNWEVWCMKDLFFGKYKEAQRDYLAAVYQSKLQSKALKNSLHLFAGAVESCEDDMSRFQSRGDEKMRRRGRLY